jgi:hypothetical protein
MFEWISVKERLPELKKMVLCCGAKGGVFVARLWSTWTRDDGSIGCHWDVPNSRTGREAVYWMEFPDAPIK